MRKLLQITLLLFITCTLAFAGGATLQTTWSPTSIFQKVKSGSKYNSIINFTVTNVSFGILDNTQIEVIYNSGNITPITIPSSNIFIAGGSSPVTTSSTLGYTFNLMNSTFTGTLTGFIRIKNGSNSYTNALPFTFEVSNSTNNEIDETFSYTGSMQSFTVPSCVSVVTITAYGAKGANGADNINNGVGGTAALGSSVTGVMNVSSGAVLNVFVGGAAVGKNGGYNGGGNGGNTTSPLGGGGGGATDIRINGIDPSNRIFVAAGGGGGGAAGNDTRIAGLAVNGGNFGMQGGTANNNQSNPNAGGFGAVTSIGGLGGSGCSSFLGSSGTNGNENGMGGNGGSISAVFQGAFYNGGGAGGAGGGGYVGGGAGGAGTSGTIICQGNGTSGGGGGASGSNYAEATFTNTNFVDNVWDGDGMVTISYKLDATVITTQPVSQTVCGGTMAPFTVSATGPNLSYA